MLDLNQITRKLTQGQPEADMTLRTERAGAAETDSGQAGPASPPQAAAVANGGASDVDVQALAKKVLALMRDDLAVQRDRKGGRRK